MGISKDIVKMQEVCMSCIRNAPSQPALPLVTPPVPEYPFQHIRSDYFMYAGQQYLVIVDRYSVWPFVHLCKEESAKELIKVLREFFCT